VKNLSGFNFFKVYRRICSVIITVRLERDTVIVKVVCCVCDDCSDSGSVDVEFEPGGFIRLLLWQRNDRRSVTCWTAYNT